MRNLIPKHTHITFNTLDRGFGVWRQILIFHESNGRPTMASVWFQALWYPSARFDMSNQDAPPLRLLRLRLFMPPTSTHSAVLLKSTVALRMRPRPCCAQRRRKRV